MLQVNDPDLQYQLAIIETTLCELQLTWKPSTSHLSYTLHTGSWGPSLTQLSNVATLAIEGQWLIESVDDEDGDTGDPDFVPLQNDDAEIADQIEQMLLSS